MMSEVDDVLEVAISQGFNISTLAHELMPTAFKYMNIISMRLNIYDDDGKDITFEYPEDHGMLFFFKCNIFIR